MGIAVDTGGLEELRQQLVGMDAEFDTFCRKFLLQMGLRCLAAVKKRTPVDTGMLRNSWKIGEVRRGLGGYEIDIINPIEYASYLEYGHWQRRRWVPGVWVGGKFVYDPDAKTGMLLTDKYVKGFYMLRLSMEQIEREMPTRLRTAFDAWVKSI